MKEEKEGEQKRVLGTENSVRSLLRWGSGGLNDVREPRTSRQSLSAKLWIC